VIANANRDLKGRGESTLEQTGVLGLTDRAEAIGGRFAVESPRGRGTTISVELPIATPATP
jgi:two-component system, NarL family, sensor histidine kinase DesK